MHNGQTKEQRTAYTRQYKAVPGNREKVRARYAVQRALKSGTLVRQPCETCGAEKTHGHHDDYSKRLEVRWLCHSCHAAVHAPEKAKKHCRRGHAMTPDNVAGGQRRCLECNRTRSREYAQRKHASHQLPV